MDAKMDGNITALTVCPEVLVCLVWYQVGTACSWFDQLCTKNMRWDIITLNYEKSLKIIIVIIIVQSVFIKSTTIKNIYNKGRLLFKCGFLCKTYVLTVLCDFLDVWAACLSEVVEISRLRVTVVHHFVRHDDWKQHSCLHQISFIISYLRCKWQVYFQTFSQYIT